MAQPETGKVKTSDDESVELETTPGRRGNYDTLAGQRQKDR